MSTVVEIRNVSITYGAGPAAVAAVRDVSLTVEKGEILGLVGESGSGKSSLVSAMLGLLPSNARMEGSLSVEGQDLATLSSSERRRMRGTTVATVSQDPFTALNPVVPIGRQLAEFQHWQAGSRAEKTGRARDMLAKVGLSDPDIRMKQFPHQLSGGIRQRVAIAAALLTSPRLLIADEPTTALDATTEAQIVELIREMRSLVEGSIVIVTHDMGLVGELCDRVAVMYRGRLMETGTVAEVFANPQTSYTRALLACDPARITEPTRHLPTIQSIMAAEAAGGVA
jgi:peptide/nickel transport system ATP-binding protein